MPSSPNLPTFEEKPARTKSRFRHLPLDQRPAARAALKSIVEINPKQSTGSALKTSADDEAKQLNGRGRKRSWIACEKMSAKAAKRDHGAENGKGPAAVRVDSETTEDEDEGDVVVIKEVTHNDIE